jgi:hypothetical protein
MLHKVKGNKWTEERYKKAQIRRENKQLLLGVYAAIRWRFNLEMGKESPRPYLDAIIAGELVEIIMKRSALWEKETGQKLADIGEDKLGYLFVKMACRGTDSEEQLNPAGLFP